MSEDYRVSEIELIKNIDCISVRESQGLEIIKTLTNRPSCQVLDPTLLLDKNEWLDSIGLDNYMPEVKRYVIIYTITFFLVLLEVRQFELRLLVFLRFAFHILNLVSIPLFPKVGRGDIRRYGLWFPCLHFYS